jgi:hypothetical protein
MNKILKNWSNENGQKVICHHYEEKSVSFQIFNENSDENSEVFIICALTN